MVHRCPANLSDHSLCYCKANQIYCNAYIRMLRRICVSDMAFNISIDNTRKPLALHFLFLRIYFRETPDQLYEYHSKALSYIAYFALIFIIIVGFKYLSSFLPLNKLIFWGKNSYILLGLHGCFLDLWSTVYTVVIHQPISEIPALFVLTATILSFYPLILLLNRYCPVLVGKKDLIKYKTAGREERPAVTTAAE